METIVEKMLALQEQDRRILEARRQTDEIPKKKERIEGELVQHSEVLDQTKTEKVSVQASIDAAELEIGAAKERMAKLRQQQMELKTNKEFRAMEKEIGAVVAEIGRFEETELGFMEKMEAANGEIEVRTQELRAEEARVADEVAALDSRLESIQVGLAESERMRADLAVAVEPSWLKAYERIFANKQDFAIVRIEHRVCAGCHMTLPPHVVQAAKKKSEILTCDFCGRMLYYDGA